MMRIEDYAVIGDCETAALVGSNGSIDWLCVPRIDSDACFAALLGRPEHGCWQIAPAHDATSERAYLGDSLILATEFTTKTGKARVIDFMLPMAPARVVVRIVEGLEGHVEMKTALTIRFDYGATVPWVRRLDSKTLLAVAGPHLLALRTPVPMRGENMHSVASFTVHRGERVPFVLSYGESHGPEPMVFDADIELERTAKFWAGWAAKCRVQGPWRKRIMRSLLTLKALSYRPTGAIVAAVTTSLPEQIGGPRNWDYRYCWLRDSTLTLLAFLNAGYTEEADIWQQWLSRAVAGAPDQIQIMYSVTGQKRLPEMELPHLPGFRNSRPVRIGNGAAGQLQLDVFGELADTMAVARRAGLTPPPESAAIGKALLDHLASVWEQPDEGIWEIRGPRQHFVHSKVMAWVTFDRASRMEGPSKADQARYRKLAARIHAHVCANGVDKARGCFVQAYGSTRMDASLLLLPALGFLPASDKRIANTIAEVERVLIDRGLVLRYETESGVDALPPGEGAFLACSFWLVDAYLLQGRVTEARRLFNRLSRLANDVGLFAEEYDPQAREMRGNFPQAFTHVGLINSAIAFMAHEESHAKGKGKLGAIGPLAARVRRSGRHKA